jgi:hypothetical protein
MAVISSAPSLPSWESFSDRPSFYLARLRVRQQGDDDLAGEVGGDSAQQGGEMWHAGGRVSDLVAEEALTSQRRGQAVAQGRGQFWVGWEVAHF